MMNELHPHDSPMREIALHSMGAHGITAEPIATMEQQVPQAPQAPATPQVQGMSQEARQAIADAIREAQRATAEAREQARQAQEQARQAQEQAGEVRVTVGPERILVGPGAPAGGIGQGGMLVPPPPPGPFDNVPPQVFDIVFAFFFMVAFIAVGTAVARAFGRRGENRPVQVAPNPEMAAQLQRIEHAVEAMAIEVERISEAQRYMARLESERVADPALLGRPGRRE